MGEIVQGDTVVWKREFDGGEWEIGPYGRVAFCQFRGTKILVKPGGTLLTNDLVNCDTTVEDGGFSHGNRIEGGSYIDHTAYRSEDGG